MSPTELITAQGLRIAVEGCGHGVLHSIYASIGKACEEAGWSGVDLVIIGGDFQAVRNADDLACVSIPPKYRSMQDFHEYYSGHRKAPYLTIFVGGNHEASNYLFELYHGGWVAPNIYFMGAANVLRVGPLRIAGMSGIWKGYDYRKPHYERLPYNQDDVKSVYHTRELDVRKLLNVRTQVDIGISHDWPNGVEWKGNYQRLFRQKDLFEQDARAGTLGNKAARYVLDRLRPRYWFSAHLHVKYSAVVHHETKPFARDSVPEPSSDPTKNNDIIDLDVEDTVSSSKNDETRQPPIISNTDEIDLDLDMDGDDETTISSKVPTGMNGAPEPISEDGDTQKQHNQVPDDLRAQLPAAFTRTRTPPPESLPFPEDITNATTKFLALDKCLPNRHFLQLMSVPSQGQESTITRPVKLEYDREWLAICRVFASDLSLGDESSAVRKDQGEAMYRPLIEAEEEWVQKNIVGPNRMMVPENFQVTAPTYDEKRGIVQVKMPREYSNNQTKAFCELLEIANPFDMSEEQRDARERQGPKQSSRPDGGNRRGFGGGRGGGRGRGRGRGHPRRGGRW